MDTMRILDQHIDQSMLTLPPAEAGHCHFIWTDAPRRRQSGEEDIRMLTAPSITSTEHEKNETTTTTATTESGAGRLLGEMLQACRHSVRVPRKQMQKILARMEETQQETPEQNHDSGRRWSVATLVESESCFQEWTKAKHQ